jgi:sulfoxide reductase heme-binding subunit YedZ
MQASFDSSSSKPFLEQHPRLTNHLVLAGLTLIACLISAVFATPGQAFFETISVGAGYIGLLLIFASLVIGPLNMLKVRKNPVNINLRRDVGIWAGITSLAHVVFAAALELSWGDSLLGFFFYKNGAPKFNLFGISDMFGLVAALVVLFLMVLSNNYFLKKLKGKNWKKMQRFNYLLFGVALLHTLLQQVNNERGITMIVGVIALALGVMVAQAIGFVIYRKREQQRKPANAAPPKAVRRATVVQSERVEPAYSASVATRQGGLLPKLTMFGFAGLLALFAGFEIGQQGAQLVSSGVNASAPASNSNSASNNTASSASNNTSNSSDNSGAINNNSNSSSSSSASNSSGSSSSSSGRARVRQPSFSQPPVRTQHS